VQFEGDLSQKIRAETDIKGYPVTANPGVLTDPAGIGKDLMPIGAKGHLEKDQGMRGAVLGRGGFHGALYPVRIELNGAGYWPP
jgi:hypothetical protein